MQVKQQFVVAHPRPVVWDYFGKIDKVTLCMPGASLVEPATGNQTKFKFNIQLGPIRAAFVGNAEMERDPANFRGIIRGNGVDSLGNSRAKGVLEYALSEETDKSATRVDFTAEFSLAGALAQFSRFGLINDLAARITADFAKNIESALTIETMPESTSSPKTDGSSSPTPTAKAGELNAGKFLVWATWDWIKSLVGRIFSRQSHQ
jgi:carbon monoxide dehydrogenase subunit G